MIFKHNDHLAVVKARIAPVQLSKFVHQECTVITQCRWRVREKNRDHVKVGATCPCFSSNILMRTLVVFPQQQAPQAKLSSSNDSQCLQAVLSARRVVLRPAWLARCRPACRRWLGKLKKESAPQLRSPRCAAPGSRRSAAPSGGAKNSHKLRLFYT